MRDEQQRAEVGDTLALDLENANQGTDRGRALVEASLQECGAGRSILADRDGTIIAGNKTLDAARKLGLPVRIIESAGEELVVVRRSDLKLGVDARARRLAYLDNRTSELGLEWDPGQLLADVEGGIDLMGIFSEEELCELLAAPTSGRTDPDESVEPPTELITQVGDLWLLGPHRLLCGDATNVEDVERLMSGKRASLTATDPPYLVDYQGGQHPSSTANKGAATKDKHWDAYIDHEHSVEFYVDFLRAAVDLALTENAAIYQCFGIMRTEVIWQAWREVGLLPHQVLIWKKTRAVLTYSHFMWDYEPLMYGWPEGHMPKTKPPADARAVWEIASTIEDDASGLHPTQKPVELVRRPMTYHTKPGGIIYEPFAGSGTAIIAAEMSGRRCYALEQAPAFVDAAVARWERFTGKQAQRG